MRAKFIYEKFSETSDPVADMGIGGVNLGNLFTEGRKKLQVDQKKLIERSNARWGTFIHETLVGKTITAYLEIMPAYDSKTMEKKPNQKEGRGKFTIKVLDIGTVESLEHEWSHYLIIQGDDRIIYKMDMNQKIYISE